MTEIFDGDVGIVVISNIKAMRMSCRTECSPFREVDAIVEVMGGASDVQGVGGKSECKG